MSAWDYLPPNLLPPYRDPDSVYRQWPDPLAVRGVVYEGSAHFGGVPPSIEMRFNDTPPLPLTAEQMRMICAHDGHRWGGMSCIYCGEPVPDLERPFVICIRQAGPHGSELFLSRGPGHTITVPLSWGNLAVLCKQAVEGMERLEKERDG